MRVFEDVVRGGAVHGDDFAITGVRGSVIAVALEGGIEITVQRVDGEGGDGGANARVCNRECSL